MSDQKTYTVRNAYAAAYLVYAGLVLLETNKVGEKSLDFVFLDNGEESAEQLEHDFWNDREVASPKMLLEAYREIRQEIYKAKQQK